MLYVAVLSCNTQCCCDRNRKPEQQGYSRCSTCNLLSQHVGPAYEPKEKHTAHAAAYNAHSCCASQRALPIHFNSCRSAASAHAALRHQFCKLANAAKQTCIGLLQDFDKGHAQQATQRSLDLSAMLKIASSDAARSNDCHAMQSAMGVLVQCA